MNRQEFLEQLRKGLAGLPQEDIEERLNFYNEMIDDRMEDGLTEEEAVSQIGQVDDIIAQIVSETPLPVLVKEKVRPKRRLRAWEVVFLILGSPIWLSLLIVFFAVILVIYIVLWVVLIVLWAVEAAIWACALFGVVYGIFMLISGNAATGLMLVGAGCICAGLSVFMFFLCKAASKGIIILTKKIALCIKYMFVGRRRSK